MVTRDEWRDDGRREGAFQVPTAGTPSVPTAMEALPQQGQIAFVDCPSCQTPNQFPQAPTAVMVQCGNCSRQFQAAGQPSLTKMLSMTSAPPRSFSSRSAPLSPTSMSISATSMPLLSPSRSRSVSMQRSPSPIRQDSNRDGEVASLYDGVSPDALVYDAISRCEQRTAAIAARTRELLVKFGEYSPPRLSHSCLNSAASSSLVPGSKAVAPMPGPLTRGSATTLPEAPQLQKSVSIQPVQVAKNFSTTALPESSTFPKTLSVQAPPPYQQLVPPRSGSPMQGARSFSAIAPPAVSTLQHSPMTTQRPTSPMPGLGLRIRQGMAAPLSSQTAASVSPTAAMRPRSLSPRPLTSTVECFSRSLSFVPTSAPVPAIVPPLSSALGMRSQTPSPWPAQGSVTMLTEISSRLPVSPSPTLSVRSRSCSPMRLGPSRYCVQPTSSIESSVITNSPSRPSNDFTPNLGLSYWLPSQMQKQDHEILKLSHLHVNGDFRPKESEAVIAKCKSCGNTGIDFLGNPCTCEYGKKRQAEFELRRQQVGIQKEGACNLFFQELGDSISTNPGLEERRHAIAREAVEQPTLTTTQAWEELAQAVVCTGAAADLANAALAGRYRSISQSAVPALDLGQDNVELRGLEGQRKEPKDTKETQIFDEETELFLNQSMKNDGAKRKTDNSSAKKSALERGPWTGKRGFAVSKTAQ